MIDKNKIVDHILFVDDKNNPKDRIIFNFHTWVEIIKGIIVKYAHKSEDEAESLIMSSYEVNNATDDYRGICVLCHELEYHWAMLIVYGNRYWEKGISELLPEDYLEWEKQYIKDHNLAEDTFEFLD